MKTKKNILSVDILQILGFSNFADTFIKNSVAMNNVILILRRHDSLFGLSTASFCFWEFISRENAARERERGGKEIFLVRPETSCSDLFAMVTNYVVWNFNKDRKDFFFFFSGQVITVSFHCIVKHMWQSSLTSTAKDYLFLCFMIYGDTLGYKSLV